jgi:hypothetical protein
MKLSRISFLILLLFLCVPSMSYAQSAAEKSWQPFWTKFSSAVKNKNFNALDALTLKPFHTSDETWDSLEQFFGSDKESRNYSWKQLAESVKSGTKKMGMIDLAGTGRSADKRLGRVTNNDYAIFVYTKNGWRWWGTMGH